MSWGLASSLLSLVIGPEGMVSSYGRGDSSWTLGSITSQKGWSGTGLKIKTGCCVEGHGLVGAIGNR